MGSTSDAILDRAAEPDDIVAGAGGDGHSGDGHVGGAGGGGVGGSGDLTDAGGIDGLDH